MKPVISQPIQRLCVALTPGEYARQQRQELGVIHALESRHAYPGYGLATGTNERRPGGEPGRRAAAPQSGAAFGCCPGWTV